MEIKVSLVIGAYNAQNTISKLFDSICNQEMLDETEIILVDDGSDESYNDLLNIYKDKLNIKLYRLPENHGIGYSKQYGIDHATGKYIIFADADDQLFGTKSIKRLYNCMKSNPNADIGIGYVLEDDIAKCYDICLWSRIYKRSIFKQTPIPNVRYNEDKLFDLYIKTIYPNKIARISNIVYSKDEPTLTKQYDIKTKQEWYFKGFKSVVSNILSIDKSSRTKATLLSYFNFLKKTLPDKINCADFIKQIDEAINMLE